MKHATAYGFRQGCRCESCRLAYQAESHRSYVSLKARKPVVPPRTVRAPECPRPLAEDYAHLRRENAKLRRIVEAALTASVAHWKENRQLRKELAARKTRAA